jgi:hypothetical protein
MSAFSSAAAAAETAAVTAETGGNDLDRKFELLEARFTQPIGLLSSRGGAGGTGSNTSSSTNNNINNNNNNSFSSPLFGGGGGGENSNLSEHSFSFSGSNHGGTALAMTVRNKNKKDGGPITSLDMVSRAAARHMRKVAATSPVMGGSSNFSFSSGNSGGGGNNNTGGSDENNDSQQTFVTGNTKSTTTTNNNNSNNNAIDNDGRIAVESPPVVVSPHRGGNSNTNKPNVARVLPLVNTNDEQHQQQQKLPKSTGSATVRVLFRFVYLQSSPSFFPVLLFNHPSLNQYRLLPPFSLSHRNASRYLNVRFHPFKINCKVLSVQVKQLLEPPMQQ